MFAAVNIFDLLKKKTSLGDALSGQTELGFSRIPPFLKGVRGILPTVVNYTLMVVEAKIVFFEIY